MTRENRKNNIAQEWARGQECLQTAELANKNQSYSRVTAEAYYYALHCARCLLLSEGLEAKTHAGVQHLVNLHFVQTARLDPMVASILVEVFGARQSADYDAAAVFSAATADRDLTRVRTYADAVTAILRQADYL